MPLFEADEQTQAIVIYTEPGGRMEADLARWVTENNSRLPIVAFMAGKFMDEMPGMSFGHAGTIVEGKADTATEKIARLAGGRHHGRRGDRRDPGPRQGDDRLEGGDVSTARLAEGDLHRRRGRRRGRRAIPRSRSKLPRSARSTSSPRPTTARVQIVEENLDECVLCYLCVEAAPEGTVRVIKLYE